MINSHDLGIIHPTWSIFHENWNGIILHHILCTCFTTKRNSTFCDKKLETPFGTSVFHSKLYLCDKYGHIIMNYAMDMCIPLVSWLINQDKSYMIAILGTLKPVRVHPTGIEPTNLSIMSWTL